MVLVFFYNHIQITSASIIPSLFFPSSHIHMVPPRSVWFRFVWTFVAINPHKSQVKDLWDMAAICFILHDLQPVFLVKSVKATLLFNILSDPFTSTEQICLNWQENPVTAVKHLVLHHIYTEETDDTSCHDGCCSQTSPINSHFQWKLFV